MGADLKLRLKVLMIDALNLEDVTPDDIDDDRPLISDGLGLDSIDALELVVSLEREFSIKVKNSEQAKHALKNVNTLAAFIEEQTASASA